MRIDDVDGSRRMPSYDIYWECDSCGAICVEEFRNHVSFRREWIVEYKYPSLSEILDLEVALLDNGDITPS